MDELEIQGKVYISSKRASEITGYAKDYVGQLARTQKIPATRVGRSWYVESSALKKHAGIAEQPSAQQSNSTLPQPFVVPVVQTRRSASTEALQALKARESLRQNHLHTWGSVRYFNDDSELFPKLFHSSEKSPVFVRKNEPNRKTHAVFSQKTNISLNPDGIIFPKNTKKKPATNSLRLSASPKTPPLFLMAPRALIGGLFVLFLLPALFFGAFYLPSGWSYDPSAHLLASSGGFNGGFELIFAYFSAIFGEGFELLLIFFTTLIDSFGGLFSLGLAFLLGLFNLE